MTEVVLVSGPPSAEISLTRGQTNPTTIVNPPAVSLALSRQLGVGPTGPAGPAGGEAYEHLQSQEASTWIVNHNFGYYPTAVGVFSVGMREVGAEVHHVSVNQTEVRFSSPYAGLARVV